MENVNKQLLDALDQIELAETEVINAKAWSAGGQAKKHCDFALTAIATARLAIAAAEQADHIVDANKMVQAAPVGWRGVIPGRRCTDSWDSARVADFNDGWNAYHHAVKSALAKLEGRPE